MALILDGTAGITAPALTDAGNLTFTGTGNRITGDFSNATVANRTLFQTSTTNSATALGILPNGTNVNASISAYNNSDPTNASFISITTGLGDQGRIQSSITGTGTYLPMTFYTGGSERMRIDTSGRVGVGWTPSGSDGLFSVSVNSVGWYLGYGANYDNYYTAGASGIQVFRNGNTERMRIDSSGNLGIGTNSPGCRVDSVGDSSSNAYRVRGRSSDNVGSIQFTDNGATTEYVWLRAPAANTFTIGTASTERMRIDSSGNVMIGTTSSTARLYAVGNSNNGIAYFQNTSAGLVNDQVQIYTSGMAASNAFYLLRCYTSGAAVQFAVRGDGTVYAVNTTIQSLSDAKTKENVVDSSDGLETILGLRPVRFDFKEGFGNGKKNQLGFIAQEVEPVFPDAVDTTGQKDATGYEYKSVGPGALIPVLVKAIQELKAELDELKAKVK